MNSQIFVYRKDGAIKILDIGHGITDHIKMDSAGWEHIATVNSSFVEAIFNKVPIELMDAILKDGSQMVETNLLRTIVF